MYCSSPQEPKLQTTDPEHATSTQKDHPWPSIPPTALSFGSRVQGPGLRGRKWWGKRTRIDAKVIVRCHLPQRQELPLLEEGWAGAGHHTGLASLHAFHRCLLTFVDVGAQSAEPGDDVNRPWISLWCLREFRAVSWFPPFGWRLLPHFCSVLPFPLLLRGEDCGYPESVLHN